MTGAVYYAGKEGLLSDIFGSEVTVSAGHIHVNGQTYPVVDDVIVLDLARAPEAVRRRVAGGDPAATSDAAFAPDIQSTFGAEWQTFPDILPEHSTEFGQYFDVAPRDLYAGKRVCDLGCGIGRWSHFLKDVARELVLVDFSDAIFVARRNLQSAGNAVFFLGDITRLPFRSDFADFILCLGVLHHLPLDCLTETRRLGRFAPTLLIYLYSKLDGGPLFWRTIFPIVDVLRRLVSGVESTAFRTAFTWAATMLLYLPLVGLGALVRPLGLSHYVPLYQFYHGKSTERLRQDAYDRFFTSIEQRVSRAEILALHDAFARIEVSSGLPKWHFLCRR